MAALRMEVRGDVQLPGTSLAMRSAMAEAIKAVVRDDERKTAGRWARPFHVFAEAKFNFWSKQRAQ